MKMIKRLAARKYKSERTAKEMCVGCGKLWHIRKVFELLVLRAGPVTRWGIEISMDIRVGKKETCRQRT